MLPMTSAVVVREMGVSDIVTGEFPDLMMV